MAKKEQKTNAMRILDEQGIAYEAMNYECDEFIDGIQVADKLKLPHETVYKTLVAVGKSKSYYVFIIPVEAELDMKKAAAAVGEKSVEMIHVKDITPVTGYVRGGCTAIGMKKRYKTVIADEVLGLQTLVVSAGRIGTQLRLDTQEFIRAAMAGTADIVKRM